MWALAAASVVAGLGMAAATFRERKADAARLTAKLSDVRELQRMQAIAAERRQMVALFEGLEKTHPEPVADLLKSALPDASPEIRERESPPPPAGWTARRLEVSFASIPLSKLADFIVLAEGKRPPWRVVECTIKAVPQPADCGQVKLLLEALEKGRP